MLLKPHNAYILHAHRKVMRSALLFASALVLLPLVAALVAADYARGTGAVISSSDKGYTLQPKMSNPPTPSQGVVISSSDQGYTMRSADRTFAEDGARTLVAVRSSSGRSFYRVSDVRAFPLTRCRMTPVYVQSSDSNIPRYAHSRLRCGSTQSIIS